MTRVALWVRGSTHGGSPKKNISGYKLNISVQCAFQVPVRLFCGELCYVPVTAPGKKNHTPAGFAQLALHVNRHPSVSKSADIIWTIPRTSGLKIRACAPFRLATYAVSLILQKPQQRGQDLQHKSIARWGWVRS